jgi:hypothetical protein
MRRNPLYMSGHNSNPAARKAHNAVKVAVVAGRISRPTKCEQCGADGPTCGHHENYENLLQVIWLCKRCHIRLHRSFKC